MRLIFVLAAALTCSAAATAQDVAVSQGAVSQAAVSQTRASQSAGTSPMEQASPASPDPASAVSLERIRQGLKKDPSLLHSYEVRPDFVVQVQEQAHLDELMSKLRFKSDPVPAGGLYAYEQQRRLFNPTDRPLQQPYAAFSAGEFITVALENLIGRYIANQIQVAASSAGHARAEADAKHEVDQSIEDYCAQRPDRYQIVLCNPHGR
jgi:hypothetical protein